jgi:hypothetical protein
MGRADLELEGLDLCVDVVVATVRGGWLVDEIEEDDDDDKGRGKRIKHRRGLKSQGKFAKSLANVNV